MSLKWKGETARHHAQTGGLFSSPLWSVGWGLQALEGITTAGRSLARGFGLLVLGSVSPQLTLAVSVLHLGASVGLSPAMQGASSQHQLQSQGHITCYKDLQRRLV